MAATVSKHAPTEESRVGVQTVLDAMTLDVDAIAREVADAIHGHLSEELDPDLYERTLRSTRSNIEMILGMLSEGVDPYLATLLPDGLGYANEFARRDLDLDLLLRVYRKGEAAFLNIWLDRLREALPTAGLLTHGFGFINDWMFGWSERLEAELTRVYTIERDRWVRGTAAMHAERVRSLLENPNSDRRQAGQELNYEFDRQHLGFVVWSARAEADPIARVAHLPLGEMERLAGEVAELVGGHRVLTVPLGADLTCWTGSWSSLSLDSLPASLQSAADCGLQVAFGRPGRGLEGFRRSHRDALRARAVARLGRPSPGRCARFSALALEALLIHEVDDAREFVDSELGPLAEESDNMGRLRATLEVFLEESGSFRRAAQRLGIHDNTVSYRVRRAEELLEHRVGERQLELRVALRLTRLTLR